MVKLKIRNEEPVEDAEKVPELTLYLIQSGDELILKAYDEISDTHLDILYITSKGKYALAEDLPPNIGLQITKKGYIKKEQ